MIPHPSTCRHSVDHDFATSRDFSFFRSLGMASGMCFSLNPILLYTEVARQLAQSNCVLRRPGSHLWRQLILRSKIRYFGTACKYKMNGDHAKLMRSGDIRPVSPYRVYAWKVAKSDVHNVLR